MGDEQWWERVVNGGLALCNNYIHTGQLKRSEELLSQLTKTMPDHPIIQKLCSIDVANPDPELIQFFGRHWKGEDLQGKSIEIFCDQGMGDIINMFRYLEDMNRRWPGVKIVVHCYSYHQQFERLMKHVPYVHQFTDRHITCDYHSNIFSIPTIMSGCNLNTPYPAHFHLLLQKGVPPQPTLRIEQEKRKMRVGIAWKSNALNAKLSSRKSMSIQDVQLLVDERWDLYSLIPEKAGVGFINETHLLNDLYDTACLLSTLDAVVSVDTVALHLAGTMFKKTYVLLCVNADPRWDGNYYSEWYESCRLYRQIIPGDWSQPLQLVKNGLGHLYTKMDGIGFLNGAASGALYG